MLRRLTPFAHLAWWVLSLSSVVLFAAGTVALYRGLLVPCDQRQVGELNCLQERQVLQELGLSPQFMANFYTAGVLLELLPWFIAGLLIYRYKSNRPFEFLFSLLLMTWGTIVIDDALLSWATWQHPSLNGLVPILGFCANILLLVWFFFPDGRPAQRWAIWVGILWFFRCLTGYFFPSFSLNPDNWLQPGPTLVRLAFTAALGFALVERYRRLASPVQRQQIKWVVAGGLFFALVNSMMTILNQSIPPGRPALLYSLIASPIYYGAGLAFAASLGFAILRYRLWDIDLIIRRTLIYGALTAALGLVYFGSVVLLQSAFHSLAGESNQLAIVASTLGIAFLFTPLRRRIQEGIDRRFYRKKYDAEQTLAAFGAVVREEVDLNRLKDHLLGVVEETIQPESVSLWLAQAPSAQFFTEETSSSPRVPPG